MADYTQRRCNKSSSLTLTTIRGRTAILADWDTCQSDALQTGLQMECYCMSNIIERQHRIIDPVYQEFALVKR
ncbi:MAG: hypothetical protein ABI876_02090 [Bacteroidota bacterium]